MSTESSREAFDHIRHDTIDYEIADTLFQLGEMGNETLADLLGRTQGTISGALARLRWEGVAYDTGRKHLRSSGFNENVWALGDDSVEWLTGRLVDAKALVQRIEEGIARNIERRRRQQDAA